ncbi:PilZ domain-containing protein [Thalassotalea ganghwensis]
MKHTQDSDKLEQFSEYFSIEHLFNLNLKPLSSQELCSYSEFIEQIPTPFKLATQVATLDQIAIEPLQTVKGVATQLMRYLNLQAQKVDLLMHYIVSQQDEEEHRYQGIGFGGSGVKFKSQQALAVNTLVEVKLFIEQDNCNIYCHGEVIEIAQEDEHFIGKVLFHHIRDDDRELLVRCTLHQQQKQLNALSKRRNENS